MSGRVPAWRAAGMKRRDWVIGWLMNTLLRLASDVYRAHIRAAFDHYLADEPAQDAQVGPQSSASNKAGSGYTESEIGRQIGDNEGEA